MTSLDAVYICHTTIYTTQFWANFAIYIKSSVVNRAMLIGLNTSLWSLQHVHENNCAALPKHSFQSIHARHNQWTASPCCKFFIVIQKLLFSLTLISSCLFASGSMPAAGKIRIFCDLDTRSAIESVIFLCVWLAVEWGLKVIFSLKTACPCRPVPWKINKAVIGLLIIHFFLAKCFPLQPSILKLSDFRNHFFTY